MGWNGANTYGVRVDMARWAEGINLSNVTANAPGAYQHLGGWTGTWNTNNSVLVNGSYYWWGASPSDRNLKKNIIPIQNSELNALFRDLLTTPLYHYDYIDNPEGCKINHIGMLADEAPFQMQMPDKKAINIIDGFMMSVASIKILNQENELLKTRIEKLEEQILKLTKD
jgi:hypothetical protein